LSLEQKGKLAEVLIKHQSVFSKSPHDLGCTDLVEHAIITGNAKPIKLRPYHIPLSKKVEAEKEIKSMTESLPPFIYMIYCLVTCSCHEHI
jgi:hypothetical protein